MFSSTRGWGGVNMKWRGAEITTVHQHQVGNWFWPLALMSSLRCRLDSLTYGQIGWECRPDSMHGGYDSPDFNGSVPSKKVINSCFTRAKMHLMSHGLKGESAMISSLAQYLMTNSLIKSDTLILIRNHLGFVFTPHSPSTLAPVIAARPALCRGCHYAQSAENRGRANIYIL